MPSIPRLESDSRLADAASHRSAFTEWIPTVGRALLVLGGAYVLRAVTESGVVPSLVGAAAGVAYALFWFVMADRSARHGRRGAAIAHGITATAIALPLVWETTVPFALVGPATAMAALLVISAAGLTVAWRHRLWPLVWVVTAASLVTALAVGSGTQTVALFAGYGLVLGWVSVGLGFSRDHPSVAWFVAAGNDLTFLLITAVVLVSDPERVRDVIGPVPLPGLLLALLLVYVGGMMVRAVHTGRNVTAPEIVQGILATLIGLGGADAVTRVQGRGTLVLGVTSLALAAVAYGASFTAIDRSKHRRRNFILFTSLALVFTLVAFDALLDGPAMATALAISAVAAAWGGFHRKRATLSLHGAIYATSAAVFSGLVGGGLSTLAGAGPIPDEWVTPPAWVALIAAAIVCALPVTRQGRTWGRLADVPKLLVLVATALGCAGLAMLGLSRGLPLAADGMPDPAWLSALRTGILALAAVALAAVGRSRYWVQASWLVYPILLVGGVKILMEDVPAGRPVTMVVSLAFFGASLILAPWLARRRMAGTPVAG